MSEDCFKQRSWNWDHTGVGNGEVATGL
uniref:Uncharacterized protein n=1 Tax=Anguilla anguilla TaxID=7936 RepID=A0A0E9XEK4_ANGAN